jgi:hypothetical protein
MLVSGWSLVMSVNVTLSQVITMKVIRLAIVMTFLGVGLYGVQTFIWQSNARGRTETDIENRTGHNPPTDVPILAGTALLVLAGTILCMRPTDLH